MSKNKTIVLGDKKVDRWGALDMLAPLVGAKKISLEDFLHVNGLFEEPIDPTPGSKTRNPLLARQERFLAEAETGYAHRTVGTGAEPLERNGKPVPISKEQKMLAKHASEFLAQWIPKAKRGREATVGLPEVDAKGLLASLKKLKS